MYAYFRMARDHRMLFHLLPYSQSGRLGNGYAPVLEGRGKNRKVTDWSPYDRTWGPLGRRRPYFLVGALLSSLALILMPNSTALSIS